MLCCNLWFENMWNINAFPSKTGKQIFVIWPWHWITLTWYWPFQKEWNHIQTQWCEIKYYCLFDLGSLILYPKLQQANYRTDWHDWKHYLTAHVDDNIAKPKLRIIWYRILLVFKFWPNFAEHFHNYYYIHNNDTQLWYFANLLRNIPHVYSLLPNIKYNCVALFLRQLYC